MVDDLFESVEEDIFEEIIFGDFNGDDIYEFCDFFLGNDVVNDGIEIVVSNVLIFVSDSKDVNIVFECEFISIFLKIIEIVVLEKLS